MGCSIPLLPIDSMKSGQKGPFSCIFMRDFSHKIQHFCQLLTKFWQSLAVQHNFWDIARWFMFFKKKHEMTTNVRNCHKYDKIATFCRNSCPDMSPAGFRQFPGFPKMVKNDQKGHFSSKTQGFLVYPVYEPLKSTSSVKKHEKVVKKTRKSDIFSANCKKSEDLRTFWRVSFL